MFSVTGVEAAVNFIFNLMDPEMLKTFREKYETELSAFSYADLTKAFNKNACMKQEYSLQTDDLTRDFQYGYQLFPCKAVNILNKPDGHIITDRVRIGFHRELWFTEDLTFHIVKSVYMMPYNDREKRYALERWEVEKAIKESRDLFFNPERFFCELYDYCYDIYLDKDDADITGFA